MPDSPTTPSEGFLTRWLKSQGKKKKPVTTDPKNPGIKPKPKEESTFEKIKKGYAIFKGLGKEEKK